MKISRLSALKGAFATAPSLAITGLGQQLAGLPLNEVIKCLLSNGTSVTNQPVPHIPLHEFIATSHPLALALRSHLEEQSRLMSDYLKALTKGRKRILLVDTGWAGTTQLALEKSFKEYEFFGAYFGTIGRAEILGSKVTSIHGLMFENPDFKYSESSPETVFVLHRHLIESLLEPDAPSITHITKSIIEESNKAPSISACVSKNDQWDRMFPVVESALEKLSLESPLARTQQYQRALNDLTSMLIFPDRKAAILNRGKYRSSDLGRTTGAEPLIEPKNRYEGDSSDHRIRSSLWEAGQAAIEYQDTAQRRSEQLKILLRNSRTATVDYFASTISSTVDAGNGIVAIITRTKNRPILLERAARSVASQTFENYEWIIVNDGGNLQDVVNVLKKCSVDPTKITICHNQHSLGMEAASNAGIAASKSEWIVIHDDDDSWHPKFLEQTTRFLREKRNIYQGVITGTLHITEEICGETVIEHARVPYQNWVKSVHLSEMATGNFFAPIAFVYARNIYDQVGGYDRALPVLGDWDFNLRFLMEADIGVVENELAYYHHRVASNTGTYSNSVVGGIDKHLAYNAIVRNKYLRQAGTCSKIATLAQLTSAGYLHTDTRARFDNLKGEFAHINNTFNTLASSPTKPACDQQTDNRWVLVNFLAQKLAASSNGKLKTADLLALENAEVKNLLKHIKIEIPTNFDEPAYLQANPDIHASVTAGQFDNGYTHYLLHGRREGRPRPSIQS